MNLEKLLADEVSRCSASLRLFEPEKNYVDTILNYSWTYQRCESEFIDNASRIVKEFIALYPDQEDYAIKNFSAYLTNIRRLYQPPRNPNPGR